MATTLTPTQRYVAGALLALALRQAQIHQSVLIGSPAATADDADDERTSSAIGRSVGSGDAASDADLWTHDSRGLLHPVFRFFEIDPNAWAGLEEMAASPEAKHHISASVLGELIWGFQCWIGRAIRSRGGSGETKAVGEKREGADVEADGVGEDAVGAVVR